MNVFTLLFCLLLAGCDLSPFFWEKEGAKVVEDVVEEEEKPRP